MRTNLELAKLLLRIAPALLMILFGINQMIKPDYWYKFVPQWIPLDVASFMKLHALANILLGIWLLSGIKSKWSTLICLIWFLTIVPFAWSVDWTIGARDAVTSAGLLALLLLQ